MPMTRVPVARTRDEAQPAKETREAQGAAEQVDHVASVAQIGSAEDPGRGPLILRAPGAGRTKGLDPLPDPEPT